MTNKNISFDFDPKIDSKSILTKLINKAYLKNKNFFSQDVSGIKVVFLYTRSQMDKTSDQKTPDWWVGYAKDKHHIYIFSPSVFDKVSNHPASDFSYTLTHEIAHIFTYHLLDFYYPKWLHEGIAGYIAEQYKIRRIEKINEFYQLHDSKNWNQHPNYPQAFIFTKYLVNTLGKAKMLRFLKKLPKKIGRHHYPEDFTQFFNQFFKNEFNRVIFEWKKTVKVNEDN